MVTLGFFKWLQCKYERAQRGKRDEDEDEEDTSRPHEVKLKGTYSAFSEVYSMLTISNSYCLNKIPRLDLSRSDLTGSSLTGSSPQL